MLRGVNLEMLRMLRGVNLEMLRMLRGANLESCELHFCRKLLLLL